jgi:hypothetical protein
MGQTVPFQPRLGLAHLFCRPATDNHPPGQSLDSSVREKLTHGGTYLSMWISKKKYSYRGIDLWRLGLSRRSSDLEILCGVWKSAAEN